MKKFLKFFKLLMVAVGLFALGYFAPAIPNLVYTLCAKSWFGARDQEKSAEYMEQPAAYVAFEQNEPVLLPGPSIDWHMKSVDEWLAERGHHDINFRLEREKSLDQDWLLP